MNTVIIVAVVVIIILLIQLWCYTEEKFEVHHHFLNDDPESEYVKPYSGSWQSVTVSQDSMPSEFSAPYNPGGSCNTCLSQCVGTPTIDNMHCVHRCFAQCAVGSDLSCKETCVRIDDKSLNCDTLCAPTNPIGCRWDCRKGGKGGFCYSKCPSVRTGVSTEIDG